MSITKHQKIKKLMILLIELIIKEVQKEKIIEKDSDKNIV